MSFIIIGMSFHSKVKTLLAKMKKTTLEKLHYIDESELPKKGRQESQLVKVRVNQSFFRTSVLAAYNNTCCITGIQQPELIIAGHLNPGRMTRRTD